MSHDRRVPGPRWTTVRRVLGETLRRVRRRDLALSSAGASLYGALAVVPSLLAAIALVAALLGREEVQRYGLLLAGTLPGAMGAPGAADRLVDAGLNLSPLAVVFAVGMGSAYGDGLHRAFGRVSPAPDGVRPPTWWLRAVTLPLLGLAPLMLAGLLVTTPYLSRVNDTSGVAGVALASYLSLTLVWILTWLPLTWTFRVVAPGQLRWRSALAGAVVTGAFVSGFLQGFVLFLALPVDLGRPFGGLEGVGVASALLLWLWVLHAVVLVGFVLARTLDDHFRARDGDAPAGPAAVPRSAGGGATRALVEDDPRVGR